MSSPPNMRSESPSSIASISSIAEAVNRNTNVESEPTIQISIKPLQGETFSLTVPTSTSISTLRSLLALRTNTPESELRLSHNGKHLSTLTDSLATYEIQPSSTLHISLPPRTAAASSARRKSPRCNAKDCSAAAQRIVGDCGFCSGHFCAKHRMLEAHACPKLEDCKAAEKERNREKLESERTFAIRGI